MLAIFYVIFDLVIRINVFQIRQLIHYFNKCVKLNRTSAHKRGASVDHILVKTNLTNVEKTIDDNGKPMTKMSNYIQYEFIIYIYFCLTNYIVYMKLFVSFEKNHNVGLRQYFSFFFIISCLYNLDS